MSEAEQKSLLRMKQVQRWEWLGRRRSHDIYSKLLQRDNKCTLRRRIGSNVLSSVWVRPVFECRESGYLLFGEGMTGCDADERWTVDRGPQISCIVYCLPVGLLTVT